MDQFIWDIGLKVLRMVMEHGLEEMVNSRGVIIKEILGIVDVMGLGSSVGLMERSIEGHGRIIYFMVKGNMTGQVEKCIVEDGIRAQNMAMGYSRAQMEKCIMGSIIKDRDMGKEYMLLQMELGRKQSG